MRLHIAEPQKHSPQAPVTSAGAASIHPSLRPQKNLSGAGNLIEWEDRSQVNDPVVLQGRGQRITDCLMTKLYEKQMTRNKNSYLPRVTCWSE